MLNSVAVKSILSQLPAAKQYWVAYSGGVDSHVLLYLLAKFLSPQLKKQLQAVHINHGLSQHATQWEQHCQLVCRQLGVAYKIIRVKVKQIKGASLEDQLRRVRYEAFANLMQVGDCLLAAHHQNDQCETLLLQLLRGAGVKGLRGMGVSRQFANGTLCRPLLNFSRAQLQQYAEGEKLVWVNDESNSDLTWDRNYLRHKVLPLVQERWPGALKTIARSSGHCAVADELLDELAALDYQSCVNPVANTLAIEALQTLTESRQRNLLRYWIRITGFMLPNHHYLERIQTEMLTSRRDAMPHVTWGGAEVRRYRGHLYLQPALSSHDPTHVIAWDMVKPLSLPGKIGLLQAKCSKGKGLIIPPNEKLWIKFRQGGERCYLQGHLGSRKLKKLFQQWGVSPWLRDRIPLIFGGERLLSVVGYCINRPFAAGADEIGWEVSLTRHD